MTVNTLFSLRKRNETIELLTCRVFTNAINPIYTTRGVNVLPRDQKRSDVSRPSDPNSRRETETIVLLRAIIVNSTRSLAILSDLLGYEITTDPRGESLLERFASRRNRFSKKTIFYEQNNQLSGIHGCTKIEGNSFSNDKFSGQKFRAIVDCCI